jgi:DNA replication protein
MSEFKGFPERLQFTPVPNLVFSSLAGQINDIVELKTLLHIFEILYLKKGSPRYITADELLVHPSLVQDLKQITRASLVQALEALVDKGILIKQPVVNLNERLLYFINNAPNRAIVEKIRNSEISFEGFPAPPLPPPPAATPPDIFTLYEENVGLITPLIADELKEAQNNYPEGWIKEAIKEAVKLNKRNWKYISRILERWSTEGKKDGAYRGNLEKNTDPDKYIRGKYGHLVQRRPRS